MNKHHILFALFLLAPACGDSGSDDTTGTDGGTDTAGVCEPGEVNACACPDGAGGTQVCADDGMSFGMCECGGGSTTSDTDTGTGTSVGTSDGTSGSTSGATATAGSSTSDGTTGGPVGEPPTAQINHPGDGEVRKVNVAIPFVGVAMDAEDGTLSGAAMQWSSDLEGALGEGESFDKALTMLGDHVITLEVTDSDQNVTTDQITITIEQ